jgi:hypothetical protein
MTTNCGRSLSRRLHRVAIAIAASGVLVTYGGQANPSDRIILVPPSVLPELSERNGEVMLLHQSIEGRTLSYIEQMQRAELATFDLTGPAHIKAKVTVELHDSEPFDFAFPLGHEAELIRFRHGLETAVLDLHKETFPRLKSLEGLTWQGSMTPLGNDELWLTTQGTQGTQTDRDRDYQVMEPWSSEQLNRLFDVKQVSEEKTNAAAGATFRLSESGLYVIRRPDAEWRHRLMEITPN